MFIESKQHKEIVGHVDGQPYHVNFDANGQAEVEEAVGKQLLRLKAAVAVQVEPTGFQAMKLEELKTYAKDHQITLGQARTKDAIIHVIEEFGSQNQNDVTGEGEGQDGGQSDDNEPEENGEKEGEGEGEGAAE